MPLGTAFDISLAWPTDAVKCCLLSSSFVWDRSTMTLYSHVSGSEVSGTGYTAGGATVAGKSRTVVQTGTSVGGDNHSYALKYDCDDVTFSGVTLSNVRYYCFYVVASGRIIAIFEDLEPFSVTSADVVFQVPQAGLFTRDLR